MQNLFLLSGPIHSAGRAAFFFRSFPLCWARRLLFFLSARCRSAASVRATFFLSGQQLFFFISSSSACNVWARAEPFFWTLLHSVVSPRARNFYFGLSGQQLLRMQKFFSLCPVASTLQGSQRFFYFFSLSGRFNSAGELAILLFFSSARSLQLCRGASDSFFSQSLPVNSCCAHRVFFYRSQPHSTAEPCRFLFFIHSHAQMQGAQNFSFAQFFSFAVRSHLLRHFVLIFLWHMESLQYTFSESCVRNLNFLASSLCCFWLSDHTGQNQLNWPMGAVEPVLRTSSTAYIYLTLPFSSPTSSTLALVASQHLEPLFHTPQPVHHFFNHGASSQPFSD
jgi:hypothetical protein